MSVLRRAMGMAAALAVQPGEALRAQTPQEIERAAAEAARRLELQTDLPRQPESLTGWRFNWDLDLPVIEISSWMLWAGLVIALALVLHAFRDELPAWPWRRDAGWGAGADDTSDGAAHSEAAAWANADALAGQGRYGEAMHVLLLRALAEMRERLDEPFADSLTSREILRSVRLSEPGQAALREMVTRVEWSYFGERPAAGADYAACRDSFMRLVLAMQGGGWP